MPDLSDFGAGGLPEKSEDTFAHDTRSDRAEHRRRTYRLGRCRGISTSKGRRCGGAVIEETDGQVCHYHGQDDDHPTIDDDPGLVARWCGLRATMWEEIPEPCRDALAVIEEGRRDG